MKYSTCFLVFCVLIIFAQSKVFATDDFEIRPPVLVPDNKNGKRYDDSMYLKLNHLDEEEGNQTQYNNLDKEFSELFIRSPLVYLSFGVQTQSTWFDRRLNWSSYSTTFVLDTGNIGFRYQGSMSNSGRDSFELFDSRFDIYAYWLPEFIMESDPGLARIGGGISYFDCEPYQGQEFLFDQHYAAFANIYFIFMELKFAMLINDDVWNGGLIEFKIFNPFLYLGLHFPDTAPPGIGYLLVSTMNLFLPYEIGITGSFDLPNESDGWGWYVKGRYNILFPTLEEDDGHLSLGAEIYWSYSDGFDNTKVSGGWEFGIKFVLVGF